jgi:hypothetical protein
MSLKIATDPEGDCGDRSNENTHVLTTPFPYFDRLSTVTVMGLRHRQHGSIHDANSSVDSLKITIKQLDGWMLQYLSRH